MEERLHLKGCFALEHVIDGPRELVGQDGQGFPLAVFFLQAGHIVLSCRVVAQAQRRSFGKGPLQVGFPIFLPDVLKRLPADSLAPLTRRQ